ncbi:MAG: tRNA pseudouridine(13) synthase TruD [Spirochaetia bacterium]
MLRSLPVKLKVTPMDFLVEEETDLPLSPRASPYAVFRLSKKSWDTFDLIDLLARRLRVRREDISVGGIKDRHGSTSQLVTVKGLRGRPGPLKETNFTLEFKGWSETPVSAKEVRGNRFTITLRDVGPGEVSRYQRNVETVAHGGFPNYFDEQRFGSARHGAGFMGKEICLGRRENALRLYFTPSKHDDQKTRKLKKCVIENWGTWQECAGLGFGEYGRVLSYLAGSRRAYHQALEMIDRRFLLFVVNAYQSFLFNEVLARWMRTLAQAEHFPLYSLKYAFGEYEFFDALPAGISARIAKTMLPVPGHDSVVADESVAKVLRGVLADEGIHLADLRVRQMRRIIVHGVQRHALVIPEDLNASDFEEDDLYPGKRKMTVRFFLPRGSYATILIKRIALAIP